MAAMSSCIVGLPGDDLPVLGRVTISVGKLQSCRREETWAKGAGPSQKPGTMRMVGEDMCGYLAKGWQFEFKASLETLDGCKPDLARRGVVIVKETDMAQKSSKKNGDCEVT